MSRWVSGPRLAPVFLVLAILSGCVQQLPATAGRSSSDDPYYPALGNSGYDVKRYAIALDIVPESNTVAAEAQIEATATEPLASFYLDFGGLTIDEALVNNAPAETRQEDTELLVTPARPLAAGRDFQVKIRYYGQPALAPDPVFADSEGIGWAHGTDGSITVMNEPSGARGWFPVNDHPSDKAAYRFEITVPEPWVVAASGELREQRDLGDRTRFVFESAQPVASYLASVNVDRYEVEKLDGPNGVIIRNYFPPGYLENQKNHFRDVPEMMAYFGGLFGPYPYKEYASVIGNEAHPWCAGGGGAAEQHEMAVHCSGLSAAAEIVVAHELAHQWFGNSVGLETWRDVWLKEGMATYAEWLWLTREKDAQALDKVVKAQTSMHHAYTPVSNPGSDKLYNPEVYVGGALVFHAIRKQVGDDAFFKIIRTYLERYRDGTASAAEFFGLVEEVSGQELSAQFDEWVNRVGEPEFE